MSGEIVTKEISKSYGSNQALAPFSYTFESGKIHALMGKNGSGKSTLIKIIAGSIGADGGELFIDKQRCQFTHPSQAFAAGVITVHQELSLVPGLSVAENLFLGRLPRKTVAGLSYVNWSELERNATELLQQAEVHIKANDVVKNLSVGEQQMVEILKAYAKSPKILLLDEPTSALSNREVEQLFKLIRVLRERGVTMLYITHRMNEIFELADTCTILRDSEHIKSCSIDELEPRDVVESMFGETEAEQHAHESAEITDQAVLEVEGLTRTGHFEDISFKLKKGEVLGFAGLMGSGRTEILRSIFGADELDSGSITVNNQAIANPSPAVMKKLGLGYTPENRKEVGLLQEASIHDNLCLASLDHIAKNGYLNRKMEKPLVDRQVKDLQIKVGSVNHPVSSLSGGNQQKVVLGNWMNTNPRIMFFDEPSRGIDYQAKRQIFTIIREKAKQGLSSILVSSEPEELLTTCDRILVFSHGKLVGELFPNDIELHDIYDLMMRGES